MIFLAAVWFEGNLKAINHVAGSLWRKARMVDGGWLLLEGTSDHSLVLQTR